MPLSFAFGLLEYGQHKVAWNDVIDLCALIYVIWTLRTSGMKHNWYLQYSYFQYCIDGKESSSVPAFSLQGRRLYDHPPTEVGTESPAHVQAQPYTLAWAGLSVPTSVLV